MNSLDGRARAAREAYATLSQWAASARAAACGASKNADVRLELGIDEAGLVAALNTIGECPAVAVVGPNILPLMKQFREDAQAAQLVAWTRPVARAFGALLNALKQLKRARAENSTVFDKVLHTGDVLKEVLDFTMDCDSTAARTWREDVHPVWQSAPYRGLGELLVDERGFPIDTRDLLRTQCRLFAQCIPASRTVWVEVPSPEYPTIEDAIAAFRRFKQRQWEDLFGRCELDLQLENVRLREENRERARLCKLNKIPVIPESMWYYQLRNMQRNDPEKYAEMLAERQKNRQTLCFSKQQKLLHKRYIRPTLTKDHRFEIRLQAGWHPLPCYDGARKRLVLDGPEFAGLIIRGAGSSCTHIIGELCVSHTLEPGYLRRKRIADIIHQDDADEVAQLEAMGLIDNPDPGDIHNHVEGLPGDSVMLHHLSLVQDRRVDYSGDVVLNISEFGSVCADHCIFEETATIHGQNSVGHFNNCVFRNAKGAAVSVEDHGHAYLVGVLTRIYGCGHREACESLQAHDHNTIIEVDLKEGFYESSGTSVSTLLQLENPDDDLELGTQEIVFRVNPDIGEMPNAFGDQVLYGPDEEESRVSFADRVWE
jgi:hypothetical protein